MNPLLAFTYTTTTTTTSSGWLSGGSLAAVLLVALLLAIVVIAGLWKTFQKAGKPGWAAIIPLYNTWVLAEVAGKPGWWGLAPLLGIVPIVGSIAAFVVGIIIALGVAKNFGKGTAFAVFGIAIFSPVGYCILGFGDAQYHPIDTASNDSPSASIPPTDDTQAPPTNPVD